MKGGLWRTTLQYGSILISAITRHQGGELVFTGQFISGLSQHKMNSFIRTIIYAFIAGINPGYDLIIK